MSSLIPSLLFQTWKSHSLPSFLISQTGSWAKSNSYLERRLFDDGECANFIRDNFDDRVYELYLQLPLPIMRADFWRICVVYINGGYYSDLDITCNIALGELVSDTTEFVAIKEQDNIANFFFGAIPKHPVLEKTIQYMVEEAERIIDKETQSFGMHSLHRAYREYFSVDGTDYPNTKKVVTLDYFDLKAKKAFIHSMASYDSPGEYESWRDRVAIMNSEREKVESMIFVTTFNENGYDLYGKTWVQSFSSLANYYNKIRARVYYEGFKPTVIHPCIEWINYKDVIPFHDSWKSAYLSKTNHSDYVKTMTVRFSHKAFVIQHALDDKNLKQYDYVIWLDGDCVFKQADYEGFPSSFIQEKTLACQVEEAHDLNHVESGILIFNNRSKEISKFNEHFKRWYAVDEVLQMGQPYDGFIVFKSLMTSGVNYLDLNEGYGMGGIQSDPSLTFRNPILKSKFIHNIGWTGKSQYKDWQSIQARDDIYQKMKNMLFGSSFVNRSEQSKRISTKLDKLKNARLRQ